MNTPTLLRAAPLNHFLEDTESAQERDNCIVPVRLWTKWVDRQTSEVLLVEVRQRETRIILCVESHQSQSQEHIYIPQRYFSDIEENEICFVKVIKKMPPNATKIELQLVDSEVYHTDIAAAVSKVLSNWNIITVGTVLSVPCEEMGGYMVDVIVKSCEPAETVLLRGEVPLEIAEPLIKGPSWSPSLPDTSWSPSLPEPRPPTPVPESIVPFTEEDFAQFLPSTMQPIMPQKGFIPFAGKGRTLGN